MTTTINASTTAGLIQTADTSGSLQLQTANLPAVTIDSSQNTTLAGALTVTGATTLNSSTVKAMTAQASTSGTVIDFTSIPSWVKRITVMFSALSSSGASNFLIQLGTGATPTYTTTGYVSHSISVSATNVATSNTAGYVLLNKSGATDSFSGTYTITNLTGNTWVGSSVYYCESTNCVVAAGTVSLGNTITALRFTTVNGTDTFDAGSINILYE
jgi:hypothetical protein